MSRAPRNLIPAHWSAEEARAVLELLQILSERIWQRYRRPLRELIGSTPPPPPWAPPPLQLDLFDSDDEPSGKRRQTRSAKANKPGRAGQGTCKAPPSPADHSAAK